MLRWLIGIIVGFGLWLVAGTAGAQADPPLTCPQTISGQIDSPGDPKENGRINAGVSLPTLCGQTVPAPGVIAGQYGYDRYIFKNRTASNPACIRVTLNAKSGQGLFASAYVDSFDPQNITANYIGSTGNQVLASTSRNFSVDVPALRDFVIVVNEFVDGGGGAYDLTVEGCGRILISEITPNFGPTAGGTEVVIKGAGFKPESTVTFGGVAGTNFQYISEFEIHVTTPPYTGGGASPHAVDVAVTAGPGDPEIKRGGFTYYDPANTVLTLTPSPAIVEYGASPTLIGTISPAKNPNAPTGVIEFFEGTTALGRGQIDAANSTGRIVIGGLSVGTHEFRASYAGDPFYNRADSAAATLIVNKSRTSVTLSSSQNPSGLGDAVTYTAIIRGTFAQNTTGTVTFTEDGNPIGSPVPVVNGRASSEARTYIAIGNHTIVATYSGDDNFREGNATLTQRVTANAPDINITANPETATYGTEVTFTAKVQTRPGAPAPIGKVQFTVDGQNVGPNGDINPTTGEAVLAAQKLTGGQHTIVANFTTGSRDYENGSGSLPFEVKKAQTTTTVVSSKSPSAVGEAVAFTATITTTVQGGAAFTGTVQFKDGNENLGSPITVTAGVAKLENVKTLAQGTHKITAVYSGDTNYAGVPSASIDQVVGTTGGTDGGTDSGTKDAGDSGTVKPDASGVDSGSGGGGNASTEGGGCDCNTTGTPASGLMALLGGLGFALMLVRRRRA
ncbi:Ig-like domain repeat protein [Pendulispora brunnea]|uniref:Ig-like domain repeat protein n=1 Tax=Pendulispora brunnea TaxID=2905690 RepID=A0ABZ2K3B1_9BACT